MKKLYWNYIFIFIAFFLLISFIIIFCKKDNSSPNISSISSKPENKDNGDEKFLSQYVYQNYPTDYSSLLSNKNGDWGYNSNKSYKKNFSSYSFLESPVPSERSINN